MTTPSNPLIKLEPGGKAPILSYNVPEPSTYTGKNYIGLIFPPEMFTVEARTAPNRAAAASEDQVRSALSGGYFDHSLFPNVRIRSNMLGLVDRANSGLLGPDVAAAGTAARTNALSAVGVAQDISRVFSRLDPAVVAQRLVGKQRLNIYRNMFGSFQYNFLPEPIAVNPRIFLVETYQLSTFLGNYGAGRTVKTFSLLPGEKTTISVKTYRKTETDAKSASSILDSFTQESSDEFENSVQDEHSDKQTHAESFEYHAEADAHAAWGWGSANVSGGIKGSTNSGREEFAKNISKATDKHAAKASAKRDVHVDTSYEVKEQSGEETSIQRELANINVGRTLNFVFRQMNQEFHTVLHLVDVRVGFFNGYAESRMEVTLPELDKLLEHTIVPAERDRVKAAVVESLKNIVDYQDKVQSFVEEVTRFAGEKSYFRVLKGLSSTYKYAPTGFEVQVEGIPISATHNIMRTEGIIVEALLGQGNALDDYSAALQSEAVRAKKLANDEAVARVERDTLAHTIAQAGDDAKAKVFAKVYPPLPPPCCCREGAGKDAAGGASPVAGPTP